MPVVRSQFRTQFAEADFPRLPCPRCAEGRVSLDKSTLSIVEPAYSKAEHADDAWERDWVAQRFTAQLVCDDQACGEIVVMIGDTAHAELAMNDSGDTVEIDTVIPRGIYPAVPLFKLPTQLPKLIAKELTLSFQLFWADSAACCSRLRTSVERMLDHQQVPSRTASNRFIPLKSRIGTFAAVAQNQELKEALQALRVVGNLATHGDEVDETTIFDAMDIYDFVLRALYDKAPIGKLADRLKALEV